MADTALSNMTAAAALGAADLFYAVQGAADRKVTAQQIITAATGATGVNGETVTASKPLLDLSQTWNNAAVTFTGLKFNVTNTASATGSKLLDLQTGGSSTLEVFAKYTGQIDVLKLSSYYSNMTIGVGGDAFYISGPTVPNFVAFGAGGGLGGFMQFAGGSGGFGGYAILFGQSAGDPILGRDGAIQVLALSNSTYAQTLRVYNTRTDASNYERAVFDWTTTANTLTIGTQAAGTGTARNVNLKASTFVGTEAFLCSGSGLEAYSTAADALARNVATRSLAITSSPPQFTTAKEFMYVWTSVTNGGGDGGNYISADTGISRNAAGVVEVNNGTAGTLRDIKARNFYEDTVPVYSNTPQNSQSVAYTLVLADAQKHILHPSADTTARTFTIPANASVAYPIGTTLTFVNQDSAGALTIAITTDTMRLAGAGTTGSRTLAANGIATALKLTATEWIISGTGLT